MKEYAICKPLRGEYDGFLLCLTFESILSYLTHIEKEQLISTTKGTLLIDQLLVTGNGRNRFLKCSYSYGKINITTAQNIHPESYFRELSVNLLMQNYALLHNSILTDQQKENIQKGIPF